MQASRSWPLLLAALMLGAPQSHAQAVSGLEAALNSTLARNPAVTGKRAEVEGKGFLGDSARAQRYPTLSWQAASPDSGGDNANLRVRQPLWAFGRIDSAIAYADADMTAEQADLLRVQRQLLGNTAEAYSRVQGILRQLQVARDNVVSHEALHQQIRRREGGQLASRADVRLAASRLLQARSQEERLRGELEVAESELQALTLTSVDTRPPVADAFTSLPEVKELEQLALKRSAEIERQQKLLDLAERDVEREQSSWRPTLYLQGDHYHNIVGRPDDSSVSLVLEGSFDGLGLTTIGRSRAAGARAVAAGESLQVSRNDVQRNVRSLLSSRRAQAELIAVQGEAVTELEAILASYLRQYQAGHKAWLDVLNMRRELTEQRLQYVQAENDWLIYTLRLSALIGSFDGVTGLQKD